jgi:predicted O-linked N-acetylglucosamine transferase (SPINDLY family)
MTSPVDPDQLVQQARQAVQAAPQSAERWYDLAQAQRAAGDVAGAIASLRRTVELRPDIAEVHANLGALLGQAGRVQEAAAAFERAIALRPTFEEAHANLAVTARRVGRIGTAIQILQRAIGFGVRGPAIYSQLGSCLRLCGRPEEAVAAFRRAIELRPDFREAHSNLIYALHFMPGATPGMIGAAQREWAQRFAAPLMAHAVAPHANDPSPERRIRVGYVSPDFRSHAVGAFLEPILAGHDRSRVEVVCYSDVARPDAATARMRASAGVWRDTRALDHAALAQLIRQDRIDVLVDVTLHMGGSRLLTFAHRPAPVQVTYLGYNATTGLRAIDYRLTDPHMDPPGTRTEWDVEEPVYLPETYWCYRPPAAAPEPGDSPLARNGFATFGSFNSVAKVNPAVISVWARLLHAVPSSRLLVVLSDVEDAGGPFRGAFAAQGVAPERLRFVGQLPYDQYLAHYREVDVALDPFPYAGGTTTLDALWMGVPVVTLAGRAGVERAGVTLLTNAGLPDLIATTADRYVAAAAALAGDAPRLARLRSTLRQTLRESPLTDEPRFMRHLDAAYRAMWRRWCAAR